MTQLAPGLPVEISEVLGGDEQDAKLSRLSLVPIIAVWLWLAILGVLALNLTGCAAVNEHSYKWADCTVIALDIRTGSNGFIRLFDTPHRLLERTGTCNIIPENANPSALAGFGPTVGEAAAHVVVPIQ